MLNHKEPDVQVMLALLEGQRDYAMGTAATLAKENAELKARIALIESLLPKETESPDGNATV
jgi:hypothetical protein